MTLARPVIDIHVHLYPEKRLASLMRWLHRGMPGHPMPLDITVERAVAELREAGVERFLAAVFPLAPGEAAALNRFNAQLARAVPGMIPLGSVHQDDADPAGVAREALGELGLRGIKLHPTIMSFRVDDRRMAPVFALVEEAGLPVLIHTQFDDGYGTDAEKAAWEALFRSHPRLVFLLAHAFFPDLAYAFSLPSRFENVYLDVTNVFGLMLRRERPLPFGLRPPVWGARELSEAIETNRRRVLFGSDHPAGMGTIRQILRDVEEFGLEENTVRALLYDNARELLARLGI